MKRSATYSSSSHPPWPAWIRFAKDLAVTLLLWTYFTAGFMLFFAPFYLLALIFARNRAAAFQRLNSKFYQGFFLLCRCIVPSHRWDIHPDVRRIRSSVIVCNHISYLDSILLISLYPRHTTIAKDRLFRIPVFGRMLALSGYIPSSGTGRYADLLLDSLDNIAASLASGGNVIVFPEGTRSRDGQVGLLQKGAFKIAKYCRAPIKVLNVSNTDKLFVPGKFLFNTCEGGTIVLKLIAELSPEYSREAFSIPKLMARVKSLLGTDAMHMAG
jgi:1-acyl-sn-glycerol-3-phosphate acyltransferase